jgi:amino acid transporter
MDVISPSTTSTKPLPPAPEGVFGRASSGLVRQVRTDDVMFYGWQQIGLGYIIFIIAAWQSYPGASMELATIIAAVAGIFMGVAYAMLARVYPRSGGDYVFMSRIISPPVGLTLSVSLMFWQLFYTGINGAWLAKYGLSPMFSTLGIQLHNTALVDLGNWLNGKWGLFASGTFVIVFFLMMLRRGAGLFFRTQRWASYLAVASLAVTFLTLILTATHVLNFQHNFDHLAGHGAYAKVLSDAKAGGNNISPAFSLKQTGYFILWPAFSLWFAILSVSFGGEVKDTQKGQMRGINGAVITMGIFMTALMFLYRMAFGSKFLLASNMVKPEQFPLQSSPFVNLFTGIAGGHAWLTVINSIWVIALLFYIGATGMVAVTRNMLAWSIDGVAPKWMASVSEKYHTPTWNLLVCGLVAMSILSIYCFTHLITTLGGFLGQCVPFLGVSLAAILFPFRRKRDFDGSSVSRKIGGVPVIILIGIGSFVSLALGFWRLLVDKAYGANNHLSIYFTVGVAVFGLAWFYGFKYWSKSQGVNVERRFEEIPIE